MRQVILTFLMAAVLISWAGCDSGGQDDTGYDDKDYSGFNRFEFQQQPALGFCPDTTAVYTAILERSGPDAFTFNSTVLRARQDREGACSPGIETSYGCMEELALSPRLLRREEFTLMRAVFAAVTVHRSPDPICEDVAVDPCRIGRYRWDASRHSDYVCSSDRLSSKQAAVIVDLLGTLRDAG